MSGNVSTEASSMTLLELFWFFFRISAVTFGGGIVILGIVQMEQERRGDIPEEEFNDMVSLAASMPGPIAVSIAWLMGRYYKGLRGSVAAVLGAVTPPFFIILFLSPFIIKYANLPEVAGFLKGVLAGVCAIIAGVVFKNVRGAFAGSLWNIMIYIFVMAAIGFFKIHPVIVMLTAIFIQAAREKRELRKKEARR